MSGLTNQVPSGLKEVDVIVAGGGTTGLIVASRLSDKFPDLSILVVERGQNNYNDPAVKNPLFFIENILELGEVNPRMIRYQGQPEAQLDGRASVVPAGSVLGGGSSINMLTYTRPQREDLDGWKMPGWGADEVLPYLKKFETYHGPGKPELHGFDGPIQISNASYGPTQLQDQFIEVAAKLGIPEAIDLQDLDSNHAVQRNLRYISPEGVRSDTGHAYLHPRLQDGAHPNLHVIVEHEIEKILFEDQRAVGIKFHGTPGFQNSTQSHVVKARKMVVVSAGTIGTPLLLQRSGVGAKEVLDRAGVDVVADSPGVGNEFQDHNTMLVSYYTGLLPNETYDDLLNGGTTFKKLLAEKSPMLAWNSAEITSKVRPTDDEVAAALGPEAMKLWERDFKNIPNKPIATISTANGFIIPISEEEKDERFLSLGTFLLYPYARGHTYITGPKVNDDLDMVTGILTDEAGFDLAMAKWLYKKQREIVRRLPLYRGEVAMLHPPFDASSDAAAKKRDGPLPADVADIVYTEADEEVLNAWVRASLAQNWHGIGTCKMAPQEEGGVVDQNLEVYGVEGLKLADLSVVPHNMAANTGIMAYTIGEKASDIFARELKCRK